MDLLDNNILISAFRQDLENHSVSKTWLEGALNHGRAIRIFPTVEAGFLRITTHPKIFNPPSKMTEASAFLNALSQAPTVEVVQWTPGCRACWLGLCAELKLSGNDCNDAMLAAVALEKGLRMVTFDKGFKCFPNLRLQLLENV